MSELELKALHEQAAALELERDQLDALLTDALDFLQHKPICSRLLTKGDCDCGLVELMTRVHAELDEDDEEEPDE